MEKDDKGSTLIRIGVSGGMFLLVPAYPGCPGSKAVKRSLLSASVFLREVCRRSMNFLRTCVSHSTEVQLQLQSFTLKQLFSEESCSVVGLSEKVSFQLRSELSATVEQ